MRVSKELKENYHTNCTYSTIFEAYAKLLQSIWREKKGMNTKNMETI